jgi:hypothetical protein
MGDKQRSRLLAVGSLNLTAETSRWAHAARTWPKAWHGVLHDSQQILWQWQRRKKGWWWSGFACGTTLSEQLTLENLVRWRIATDFRASVNNAVR